MRQICVIGLGYIGLPTSVMFATRGIHVVGVDISESVVAKLNNGELHIQEPEIDGLLHAAIAAGTFRATTTPEPSDVFFIAVPTPIDSEHRADLGAVRSAARAIVPHLRRGNLVILESTSPPGTTANVVQPILETSGLKAGDDFLLAYSPERVLPGRIVIELVANDRVIGGVNRASAEAARDLYRTFVQGEIMLTTSTTAEMVKLMENTFRDVNIALANEFAQIGERLGIDAWEAISLANYHPRVNVLRPGPGVGGHCIAVDPWFLVEAAPDASGLIRNAREVNDAMPHHVVARVHQIFDGDSKGRIACLGLSFKADVDDMRESPAAEIASLLARSFDVVAFDPHLPDASLSGVQVASSLEEALRGADLMLVLVNHASFQSISPADADGMRARRVFDTRNCLEHEAWRAAGFTVARLGAA